jgi:hypothetical protein
MNNQNLKRILKNQPARGPISAQRPSLSGLAAYERCQAERTGRPMAGTTRRGARPARSHHGRRWLAGAHGRARTVAQARESLGAGIRQGDRWGSSPEWHDGGEGVELGRAVAHVNAERRGGGRR